MSRVDYHEYLKTPEWAAVCRLAREQAGDACRLCGAPADESQLHVHHRTYERLGAELLADVVVLCATCHARHHDREQNDDVREMELYVSALDLVIARLKRGGAEIPLELLRDRDEAEAHVAMLAARN